MSGVHRWYGEITQAMASFSGAERCIEVKGAIPDAALVELAARVIAARDSAHGVPCTITLGTSPHYVWVVTLVECSIGYVDSITLWESEPEALAHAAALAEYADAGCRWDPRGGQAGSGCWFELDEGGGGHIMRTITTSCCVPGKGEG